MTVLALSVGKRRAHLVADTVWQPHAGHWAHVAKVIPNAVLGLVVFGRGTLGALTRFAAALDGCGLAGFDEAAETAPALYDAVVEAMRDGPEGFREGAAPEIGMVGWSERQRCMRAVHSRGDTRGIELGPGLHLAPGHAGFPADIRDQGELLDVARQQIAWCRTHPDCGPDHRFGGKLLLTTLEAERVSQTVHEC